MKLRKGVEPQGRKRKPGRHGQLADLARKLVEIDSQDSKAVAKLQTVAREILARDFGNPSWRDAQENGRLKQETSANAYAFVVAPHIDEARANGASTLSEIAIFLNERQIFSQWGYAWSSGSLAPFLQRIRRLKEEN